MTRKVLTDNEMDAVIARALARLPHAAPSPAFASRVMDRVQLPPARPVLAYRRARAWLSQPRRALAFAASYVVLASIALAVAVPWLMDQSPAIARGFEWLSTRSIALLRDAALGVAGWAVSSGLTGLFGGLPTSGPRLWVGAGLAVTGYAGGAALLHILLRAPRGTDAPAKIAA